jgi:hypothetical protein
MPPMWGVTITLSSGQKGLAGVADGAVQPLPTPAFPSRFALIREHSRELTGQRHHEQDREFCHLRSVNAVGGGHDD